MVSNTMNNLIDFNIDRYLNPYLPRNHLYILPKPISHFLGFRHTPAKEPPTTVQWILTILSTIAGLCVVGAVFTMAHGVKSLNPPVLVASLGASAILDYNAIRSPLAQPRNAVVGHTLAAIMGVAIAKLFMLAPGFFLRYDWVAGAVACAVAGWVMSATGTVHPPGGATAILACIDQDIIALGWMYPPIMLLASILMLIVACLFNNTLRQYPVFWWTPEEVGQNLSFYQRRDQAKQQQQDVEKKGSESSQPSGSSEGGKETDSERTLNREFSNEVHYVAGLEEVHLAPYELRMPPHVKLSDQEAETLQNLMMRLRTTSEVD